MLRFQCFLFQVGVHGLQIVSSRGISLGRGLPAATAAQTHATFEVFSNAAGGKHRLIEPGEENFTRNLLIIASFWFRF